MIIIAVFFGLLLLTTGTDAVCQEAPIEVVGDEDQQNAGSHLEETAPHLTEKDSTALSRQTDREEREIERLRKIVAIEGDEMFSEEKYQHYRPLPSKTIPTR